MTAAIAVLSVKQPELPGGTGSPEDAGGSSGSLALERCTAGEVPEGWNGAAEIPPNDPHPPAVSEHERAGTR
jgi:hypothetical protein